MEPGLSAVSTGIAINKTPSKLEMTGNVPEIIDFRVEPGKLEMHAENSKIEIDQSACFDECGLKGISAFTEDAVSYAYQIAARGINRIVEQGNDKGDLRRPDPGKEHFNYNAFGMFKKDWNMVTMPISRPKISFTEPKLDIKVESYKVINNAKPPKLSIAYSPSKIEIYTRKINSSSDNLNIYV